MVKSISFISTAMKNDMMNPRPKISAAIIVELIDLTPSRSVLLSLLQFVSYISYINKCDQQ